MTGEITLRGRVLPIGGLKEKILAAKNAGIKTICIPKKNEKDVEEISERALSTLASLEHKNAFLEELIRMLITREK